MTRLARLLLCTGLSLFVVSVVSAQDYQSANTNQPDSDQLRPNWVDAGTSIEDHSFLDLGVSASYGRDTAINNISGLKSQFTNVQGRLGVGLRSRTSSLSLKHDATVLQFPGSNIPFQQYQWTAFNLTRIPSRRTTWGLNLANAYGADSVRATSSVSLASVNNVQMDTSTLAGLISGNVLRQYGSLLIDHQTSESSAFTLGSNVNFQNFLSTSIRTNQYGLNGSVRKYFGPYALLGVRADGVRQNYGRASCTTSSVVGFTSLRLTQSLRLDGSAGPAFGPAQCTGNYQYEVIASTFTARGSRFYVGTSRKRGNGAVAGSLWETSGFGGLQVGNIRRFTVNLNSGYTSYHGGNLSPNSSISGYFFSGEYHRPLGQYAEWSFTARHFQRSDPSMGLARTVFFATFTWSRQNGDYRGK